MQPAELYRLTGARLQEHFLRRESLNLLYEIAHYHLMQRQRLLLEALARYEKAGFNPDQARVPAGNPDGGQWTSEGDGSAAAASASDAKPVLLASNDGTPGDNQRQNKQVNDIVNALGLTNSSPDKFTNN